MMTWHIARRELIAYLTSPFAWVVSAAFLFMNGFFFAIYVGSYAAYSAEAAAYGQEVSVAVEVVQAFVGTCGLLLVLFAPLLTMRSLATEQRDGSLALLLSSPVSSWEIVLGKLAGLVGFWLALFVVGMGYGPLLLSWYGGLQAGPLFSATLGMVLLATFASAVGLAASSLSGSQMMAAVVSWAVLLFLWIVGFLAEFDVPIIKTIGEWLGMASHYDEMAKGLITVTDLSAFVLLGFVFLFVAHQRVESHRWK